VVSQALTLFTTPVVNLFFDRLRGLAAGMVKRLRAKAAVHGPKPVEVSGD
jgi:hypothetical protein